LNIFTRIAFFALNILLIFALSSCDEPEKKTDVSDILSDSSSVAKTVAEDTIPKSPFPLINYTLDTIRNRQHYRQIINRFRRKKGNFAAFKAFTTLNRKELRFIGVGQAVVIPDTVVDDIRAYSVFPYYYPGAKNIKKIVIISTVYQAYACYEYGKLVRFAAVNSGKERTPSYPGRYSMGWKEKDHLSSIDSTWHMPYTINFHRQAGSAFHKFTMPGRPASHSCIRQFMDDAKWLYYWIDNEKYDSTHKPIPFSGTPVIIIDYYDFSPGNGYKWKYLRNNMELITDLPENPMAVEEALIPISQIPLGARGSLVNYKRFLYAEDTLRARGVIRSGVRLTQTRDFNKERRLREKKKREELERLKQDSISKSVISIAPVKKPITPQPKRDSTRVDTLKIIR